jgi:MFS transporter, putative metabolite:H+ symporter
MRERAAAGENVEMRQIVARLERLPSCSWQRNMRLIVCTAWFFDAFDSLVIAYVLPSLAGAWKLDFSQIGSLIGVGFFGQLLGSIGAGWLGERWGRIRTMILTLLIFTVMSFVCAFAWSYDSMWWFRLVQGIGLGGEVPLMATYVNEFAKAANRGRFSLSIQVLFSIGLTVVAIVGVVVVPHFGWQWMFIIGAVPALIAIPLRTMLPESPRWLGSKGRFVEADRALKRIEAIATREGRPPPPLPPDLPLVSEAQPRFADLFKGIYRKRTFAVWAIWVCTYFVTYGLTAWAPSLFRTVYKLDVQQSLLYGFILSGIGLLGTVLAIILIDWVGRKPMFIFGLGVGAVPMLAFAFIGRLSAVGVLSLVSLSFLFISILALSLATYTAEIYPTHLRALGSGVAAAWQRGASMAGPLVVGWILPNWGLNAVFIVFGIFAVVGACVCIFFATETRGQVLERLSPA